MSVVANGNLPEDFGVVDGAKAVSGIPGTHTFSGERSDYLEIQHSDTLALANGTFALTFNADTVNGTQALLSKDGNGYGDGGHMSVYIQDGWLKVRLQSENQSKYAQVRDARIEEGEDYHLSVSFGDDGLKIYVNGELKAAEPTFKTGMEDNDLSLIVGAASWYRTETRDNINSNFDGTITDVMVFGEQLAPEQMAKLAEPVTGPAAADPGMGTDADDTMTGTDAADSLNGAMGNDSIDGGAGDDNIKGGYGNDNLLGGDGDDIIEGGHGEDLMVGGAGNDLLISRSDAREPFIANVPGRDEADPDNELDEATGKLYADQPIPGDDVMIGGAGGDTFRFNPLINAKKRFIEKHTMDNGMIHWHGVAGENDDLHDHWVDGLGNDIIADFNRAEGDRIEIIGHTAELYRIEHVDGNGDGFVDHSVLHIRSNQGRNGGAHQYDELGTITVYGDLVTRADVTVDAKPALGIVDTIDQLDEALKPLTNGEAREDLNFTPPASPEGFGAIEGAKAVSGIPGTHTFSGERSDYLEIQHSEKLALANGTFALTFNADTVNGTHALLSKDGNGYGDGGHMSVYIQDGWLKVRLQSENQSKYAQVRDARIEEGEDYQLSVSFGEDGLKIYVNGELKAAEPTFKTGMEDNDLSLIVGAASWYRTETRDNINSNFDGTITDVMVFGEQLAPEQMARLAEPVTGPAAADPGMGTDADDTMTGTEGADSLNGAMGNDSIDGGAGDDNIKGGYGNDNLLGGDGDDVIEGGHGEDLMVGGAGNDLLISRSDAREPFIASVPGRDEADPDNELDPTTGKLYADQPIPGDDVMIGGAGGDTFRFNPLINAKKRFIEKHTMDNGMIHWHGVAGENDDLHNHWVDGLGNDIIADFNRAEGDKIEIIGHTAELYRIEHVDGNGDGFVDHSVLHIRSNQGRNGGAHQYDELGTITVYGDLVTRADVTVDAKPALGIVDTIDQLDEALKPLTNGEAREDLNFTPPASPEGFGTLEGAKAVSGIPGSHTFSGERSDYLEIQHSDTLALANGTFALTFNADTVNGTRALFSKDARGYGEGGHITAYVQEGTLKVVFQSEDASKYVKVNGLEVEEGRDYHVSFSFGEDGLKVYVNGDLRAAEPTFKVTLEDNAESLIVGAAGWSRSEGKEYINSNFDGTITDVMVFGEQLAPEQMAKLAEPVTGPAAADPGMGTDADDTMTGTEGSDSLNGAMGNDSIDGGAGDDTIKGGYGNDNLMGGDGDDVIEGGHGEDLMVGGDGNDLLISRSDAREPFIANVPGRDEADPDNELDPTTGKLYADQPIPGDDVMIGGAGGDTFRFNPLINAKKRFIEKHTNDDGTIRWHGVAGENDDLHNHWVDGLGNDIIADFNRAEGDKIEIIGHTAELYRIEHVDGNGDGFVDHSVLHIRSNQGRNGGAHQYDELGTITVYGDLVTRADVTVDAKPALGIVDTIDQLDEALKPLTNGEAREDLDFTPPASPEGFGAIEGAKAVSGIPGSHTFSGERSDYLEIQHSEKLALANGTFALTFNADTVNGTQALLSKDGNGYGDGGHMSVYIQDGWLKVRLQSENQSKYAQVRDARIEEGEDYHLSVSFGEDGLKIYVNGELKAAEPTFKTGMEDNDLSLIVGAASWYRTETRDNINSNFDGTITDVMVFAEQLAPDQMAKLAEPVTGPAAVDPGLGTDGNDQMTGTDAADSLNGAMGNDSIDGGAGDDNIKGGYGNDNLLGGDGDDVIEGGHGEDLMVGGAGNDLLISRSDAREPFIASVPGRDEADPDNELDPTTGKLYADQPIPGDDVMIGGAGGDTFRFNPLINAKKRFIEKHTNDDGTIRWHGVAGENDDLHNHWVDGLGNDIIADFNRAEGDKIEIIGHTAELYRIEHVDGNGDGFVDHSVLHIRSNQGRNGGAHQYDELGTITVYGDLVTRADVTVDAKPALGIVDTIDQLDEALKPLTNGEAREDLDFTPPASPEGFGAIEGAKAVSGIPGSHTFSGERSDYLEIQHSEKLALANGTFALTFNADTVNGTRALFSKDARGYGEGGHITAYVQEGTLKVVFQSEDASKYVKVNGLEVEEGRDYHVSFSFGEGGLKVYVDGELRAAEPTFKVTLEDNAESLIVGAAGWSRSEGKEYINSNFDGTITDVMVFGEQLAPEQMARLAEPVTGPAAVDPGMGTDGNDQMTGTEGSDSLNGAMGNDSIDGGAGDDTIKGGYGNDNLLGGDGDDVIEGGHGEDLMVGGDGNDLLISRSDAREPFIANVPGRDEADPDNELDPTTGKLYADQPIPGDDVMIGGAGGDTFRFNPLINAKKRFIEKHTNDDGTIRWHGVAGENDDLHDHWVDGLGNDIIADFNRAEGDRIEIIGHTAELYRIEHVDGNGDGFVDHSVLHIRSNQGRNGGAHQYDELGTITVYGDLVTRADVTVDAKPALGIVDTIDQLDEALKPLTNGEAREDLNFTPPASPQDYGVVDGAKAVSGIPGSHTFSGERSDYLEIQHSDTLALANGTFALTFNADTVNGTRALFSKDARGYGEGGHITAYVQEGVLRVVFQSDEATKYVKVNDLKVEEGRDYHVSFSFGEDGLKVYVDGDLRAAEPTFKVTLEENTESLIVGAAGWSRSEGKDYINSNFDGTITDVMVFGEQLAPGQMARLAEPVTGPAPVDPGLGTDGDDTMTGTEGSDSLNGAMGNDSIDGGAGDDNIKGGYGNDNLLGGDGDDVIEGGHGEDLMVGGAGNDLLISRSDAREPFIANVPGRDEADPDNELDEATGKLYADQPIPGDDVMIGGAGGDTFRFNPLINAKKRFIEKHTNDDGTIRWHGVAGENDDLHDHWVDGLGNDIIADFNRAEGDKIEIIGHTAELYRIEHVDGNGDGFVDHSVLHIRSNQGRNGGAHQYDELGTITVYGDLVTRADVTVDAKPALGIVDTIDQLDEALKPLTNGEAREDLQVNAPAAPQDYGVVDGTKAVSGIPGTHTFSGERSDYLEIQHSDTLALANGTFALTFNADTVNGTHALLSKDGNGYGDGGHMSVYIQDGWLKVRLQSDNQSKYAQVRDARIEEGEDYHLSVSFGEDGLKIYVNGELKAAEPTFKTGVEDNDLSLIVGAASWYRTETRDNINSNFDGTITDVMVFGEQLAPEQMAKLAEPVTGPAPVDPGLGTDGNDQMTGTEGSDSLNGAMGNDSIDGGAGDDNIKGGYGNDNLLGGDGDDVIEGGHGEDLMVGGDGNDLLISRSDAREPFIANVPGRDEADPDNELDPTTGKLYADQPIPGDDVMIGGAGGDTFRFNPLINAKKRFIEKHTNDDGTIRWHGVAGENDDLHDHWVDGLGNDIIADFNRAEGDRIEIIGHTAELYRIEHVDGNGDGFVDHSVLHIRSNQGRNGGAHQYDELGTITVYGDLVTRADVTVDAKPALGIVDTIDQLDEALKPLTNGEAREDLNFTPPASPQDYGVVDGAKAVSGIPGSHTFSGERSDYLEIQHSDTLALANGTFALTFNADTVNGTRALFSKDARGYGEGGHITAYVQEGVLRVVFQSDDATKYVKVNDLKVEEGRDYHVSFSFGEDGLKVYVDGDLRAAEPTFKVTLEDNAESLIVGAAGWSRSEGKEYINSNFDGTITDVMVFGEQLAPEQMAKLAEPVTGPAPVDPGLGTDGNDQMTGTEGSDSLNGAMGNDSIDGGAGDDNIKGGYGNDNLLGGDGDDVIEGGHGEDLMVGGDGNDLLISRSDAREPFIASVPGRDEADPDNELDPTTGKLYADQPIPGDDVMIGGAGGDTFRFNPLINAKKRFIEKHTNDDGTIRWHGVAGENDDLHNHWVDGLGNDIIADFNRAEGDRIEIIGHTAELYRIEHVDGNGDGFVDHSVLHIRSNQGRNGGAHQYDELGTITVYGDLVTRADVTVDAKAALGIVDTIDQLDEALKPLTNGEAREDLNFTPPASPEGFGTIEGAKAVSGIPGTHTFSGERSDYLEIQHSDTLALANGTFALTFNADTVNGTRALFSKDARGYGEGGHITAYVQEGVLRVVFQSEDATKYVKVNDLKVEEGRDYHVSFSFGEDGLKVYVDGELRAAEPTFKVTLEDNAESLIVGAAGWSRSEGKEYINSNFDGTITDVMVFGEQLAPEQMARLAEPVTGPAAADPGLGTDADDTMTGTEGADSLNGAMGNDSIDGGAGDDTIKGGYGNDNLMGGDGDDVIEGGHGEDLMVGGDGNDLLISRSDAREPFIANVPGRDEGDPDNELDPTTGKLYADQPIPGDDVMIGGAGGDTFRFNPLINAKKRFIEKHTNDDGTIRWHGVAGENDDLHDHWVDGLGNDIIADFNRAEGDKIEIIGHTAELYRIEHVDGNGDGFVDHSVLHIRSNQGRNGGAHQYDELGTITVYGDLVTRADVTVDAKPALGIVDTIDQLDEALKPKDPGTDVGEIQIPVSPNAIGFGNVDDLSPVSGVPGTHSFSGGRGDYLEIAHSDALSLSEGTIAMSFSLDTTSGSRTLFSKDASGYGDGGHVTAMVSYGTLYLRIQSENTSKWLGVYDQRIGEGETHHAAFSFGEDGVKVYLDGHLAAEAEDFTSGIDGNAESLIIGGSGWSRTETNRNIHSLFDGEISDVAVYDQQLSDGQVAELSAMQSETGEGGTFGEYIDVSLFSKFGAQEDDEDDDVEPGVPDAPATQDSVLVADLQPDDIGIVLTEIENDHTAYG